MVLGRAGADTWTLSICAMGSAAFGQDWEDGRGEGRRKEGDHGGVFEGA